MGYGDTVMTEHANQNDGFTVRPDFLDQPVTLDDIREAFIARYWDDFAMFDITPDMREEEGKLFDDRLKEALALAYGRGVTDTVQAFTSTPTLPLPVNSFEGDNVDMYWIVQ